MWLPFERFKVFQFQILRSHLKGALILPLSHLIFYGLRLSDYSVETFGREFLGTIDGGMIVACVAGHRSGTNREQFANILKKAAPYIFLPFFTLTGASLALDEISSALPLAVVLSLIRAFAIVCATFAGSSSISMCASKCCLCCKPCGSNLKMMIGQVLCDMMLNWNVYINSASIKSPLHSLDSPIFSFASQESKSGVTQQLLMTQKTMQTHERQRTIE